jgi:hypothetical protein
MPEVKQESFIGLTSEEAMIYKRLQDKQLAAARPIDSEEVLPQKNNSMASMLYNSALTQIHSFRG